MNQRRLRHFTVVAETLNFSRAAERLHIAQPALSTSIQKLEAELGARLFDRGTSGVQLTTAGRAALLEARRILFHGESLQRAVRAVTDGTAGQLRVGFVGSAIYHLVPTLIPTYRLEFPNVELILRDITSSATIMTMLNEDALDLGIIRTPLREPHAATLLTLQKDNLILALPPSHRLAATAEHEQIRLSDLAHEPFIMYSSGEASGLHRISMSVCEAAGFAPLIAQEATQLATVLALVASGLGIALVPEVVRGQTTLRTAYRQLQHAEVSETTLALAYLAGDESPAAARFLDLASRHQIL
jgi:DNA-binding transcriptional LysR family regulator